MKSVCVFCGSSSGHKDIYVAQARALGYALVEQDVSLVYGGGNVGLMAEIANAVLVGGGQVTGVIPKFLELKELAHTGLSSLHIVDSMHERKARMADLADAFIMLPGGFGTLEEFFEVLTWAQLTLHQKPLGILNCGGYFTPLLSFFEQMRQEGFLKQNHLDLLQVANEPVALLELLGQHQQEQLNSFRTDAR